MNSYKRNVYACVPVSTKYISSCILMNMRENMHVCTSLLAEILQTPLIIFKVLTE